MAALRLLRDDALLHDVTFAFSDGEERGAHRCVLAYQSPVFRAMFDLNSPLRAAPRIVLAGKRPNPNPNPSLSLTLSRNPNLNPNPHQASAPPSSTSSSSTATRPTRSS